MLNRPNILPEERRCILRKRNLVREGRNTFRLVRKYRRRPAQTFEEITMTKQPSKCELLAQVIEEFYRDRYAMEKQNPVPTEEYIPEAAVRNIGIRKMTLEDVKERIKRLKTRKSARLDGIIYEIWQLFPYLTNWLYSVFRMCTRYCKMPQAWRISRTILLYKKNVRTGDS